MNFKLEAAEMTYDVETSEDLRQELIKLRDKSLKANEFHDTIVLSHTIAWMAKAIEVMCKPGTGE